METTEQMSETRVTQPILAEGDLLAWTEEMAQLHAERERIGREGTELSQRVEQLQKDYEAVGERLRDAAEAAYPGVNGFHKRLLPERRSILLIQRKGNDD